MTKLVFDIEADGFLDTVSKVHCIVTKDIDTGERMNYTSASTHFSIEDGLKQLSKAETLIGHSIVDYDLRVLHKIYPEWFWSGEVVDTLIYSRLVFPDRLERDKELIKSGKKTKEDFQYKSDKGRTLSMQGRHSLKSFGVRLGYPKGDYDGGWEEFNDDMLVYCERDVDLNTRLYKALVSGHPLLPEVLDLEQRIQAVISEQQSYGWLFDKPKGEALYAELADVRSKITRELQEIFPSRKETMKTPEYFIVGVPDWRKGPDYERKLRADTKGELEDKIREYKKEHNIPDTLKSLKERIEQGPNKIKDIPFNPFSGHDVANALKEKYGWEPTQFTADGSAKTSSDILQKLPYPEIELITKINSVQDAIEKLAEGGSGYINECDKDNRIHGIVNLLGTNTHRASHRNPNMAQVTSVDKPYGKELRSMFTVPEGCKLVGSDASQQEIRVLAHYLAPYDGGNYADIVDSSDDIHTDNQNLLKLKTRGEAKTSLYAMLYGEGNHKIGQKMGIDEGEEDELLTLAIKSGVTLTTNSNGRQVLGKDNPSRENWVRKALKFSNTPYTMTNVLYYAKGVKIKNKIFKNFTGLKQLMNRLKDDVNTKRYITSLDGRRIYTDKPHKALNYLIQSSAAVISKRWLVIFDELLVEEGIRDCVHQLAFVHDECQVQSPSIYSETVGRLSQKAMRMTGQYYNFKCPLKADYKIGNDWSQTH